MSAIPAALIGGGLSLIGGLFGSSGASKAAKAQIQAGREAQELFDRKGLEAMVRQAYALYGPQASAYLRAVLPRESYARLFDQPAVNPNFTPEQQRSLDEINRRLALPVYDGGPRRMVRPGATITSDERRALQAQRDALIAAAGGRPGSTGALDLAALEEYARTNPGFLAQMRELADAEEARGRGLLSEFAADTERLGQQGEAQATEIGKYGRQQRKQIKLAAERALKGLNRQTESRLLSSGLGNSTLLTGALGANTRNLTEWEANALGEIDDRQLQMLTALREANLNRAYGRAGQKTGLQSALLDRNLNLRQAPLATELQTLTGPGFNWWQGQDTTRYYPGVSPSGSALSTLGNALSASGGYLLGHALQQPQQQTQPQPATGDYQYPLPFPIMRGRF